MSNVKRDKKTHVVKPTVKPVEDCSCTSTDTSTDCSSHDQKYDEHCDVKRTEGKTHCRRKCRTVCVVECEKEVNYKYEWCHKTKEDAKWCPIESQPLPKKCDDHHERK